VSVGAVASSGAGADADADAGASLASQAWVGCSCCGLACRLAAPQPDTPGASADATATDAPCPRCPRCAEPLREFGVRRPQLDAQRSWALLLASAVTYLPANLLPIMSTTSALETRSHTLLGGIAELWAAKAWVLAVIVFIASVAVPLLKIGALALLIAAQQHAPRWHRPERAALYRLVDAVGHWSMLDVYVVVLLTAMVRFGNLASVTPQAGLLAFTAMVVLTLLAAHSVNPKRIWAEPEAGPAPAGAGKRVPL